MMWSFGAEAAHEAVVGELAEQVLADPRRRQQCRVDFEEQNLAALALFRDPGRSDGAVGHELGPGRLRHALAVEALAPGRGNQAARADDGPPGPDDGVADDGAADGRPGDDVGKAALAARGEASL